MMEELFDSEYLTQQYIKAERKIAVTENSIEIALRLLSLGLLTMEQIAQATGLSLDKVKDLAAALKSTTA